MLLKENPFFKIKQLSQYDHLYNGNKITCLFFLCGPRPNDPRTVTGWGGWGPLLYSMIWQSIISSCCVSKSVFGKDDAFVFLFSFLSLFRNMEDGDTPGGFYIFTPAVNEMLHWTISLSQPQRPALRRRHSLIYKNCLPS